MPNQIDANGLQTKTVDEILDQILNGTASYPGYFAIYGVDINVEPNSPDGQLINLIAQQCVDIYDLIKQVNAFFDPDQATGRVLDMRCAINGVIRQGATYTQLNIDVTSNQAASLNGLDNEPTDPFTISDNAGNQFQLVNHFDFSGADTQSLLFRAADIGAVLTTPNTITNVVTVTLGIVSVNNPSAALVVGSDEETDAALRIRRANSVSLPSKGYLQGLIGALLDTDGVVQCIVLENNTASTDGNGIPSHSIWCIVQGGTDHDVAKAIYVKRNAGCGMKGSVTYQYPQIDGTLFPIKFDRPTEEDLWITFNVVAITGSIDDDYIRAQLLLLLSYKISQSADTTSIVALIKQISPNASVSAEGVSNTNGSYVTLKAPTAVNYQFTPASVRIIVNGSPGS